MKGFVDNVIKKRTVKTVTPSSLSRQTSKMETKNIHKEFNKLFKVKIEEEVHDCREETLAEHFAHKKNPEKAFFATEEGKMKINLALRDHILKCQDVHFDKKDFKQELIDKLETREEMKYIKDSLFDGIKSKIFSLEK